MAQQDILAETTGVRTHFWDEKVFKDKNGIEMWQSDELIAAKLWCITKWDNLADLQFEFIKVDWVKTLQRLWTPKLLSSVLRRLVEDPRSTRAAILLFEYIKDPDNEDDELLVDPFQDRPSQYNYCSGLTVIVTVDLRKVEWERGSTVSILIDKINSLAEKYRRKNPVSSAVTVSRINVHLVWSKHNQNPGERRSTHMARQGCVIGKLIKSSQ